MKKARLEIAKGAGIAKRHRAELEFRILKHRSEVKGAKENLTTIRRDGYRGRGISISTIPNRSGAVADPALSFSYIVRARLYGSRPVRRARELVRVFGPDGALKDLINPVSRESIPRSDWPPGYDSLRLGD
jgi:hypothetical protein